MARKMLTSEERKTHVSPFDSIAWNEHKMAKTRKIARVIAADKTRAEKRRDERKKAHEEKMNEQLNK